MVEPSSPESALIPGLPPEASARLLALLTAEPAVQEVWLYGSRAMGCHRPGSDIDLTPGGAGPWPSRSPATDGRP